MYNAKSYKNNIINKMLPMLSFCTILFVSFLLAGSARINPETDLIISAGSSFSNVRISYKFNSVAISDILKKISLDHGIKIKSSVEIKGRTSANLISATLAEALAIIFKDSPYKYSFEKDSIIIDKRHGGAFAAVSDRIGLKRVLIAPAFISPVEVKRLVDSMKSSEALVNYNEDSGVLVLDERPENAERIIEEINKKDAWAGEEARLNKPADQTKLFILKNIDLKETFADIVRMVTKPENAFPNYELNSIIITDSAETLNKINHYIQRLEKANGTPVVNFKFYRAPASIIEDIDSFGGFDKNRAAKQSDLSLAIIKNKNHYLAILEKYLKHSVFITGGRGGNAEMKILHKSITSKVSVKSHISINGGYGVKIKISEDAQAFNDVVKFKTLNYNFDLNENDMIIAQGFDKSFIDIIDQSRVNGFLSYMPALCEICERFETSAPYDKNDNSNEEKEYFLMAIEITNVKNASGIAAYSFVNLLRLDSQNYLTDAAAFTGNKSYLNIFSAPAGSEKIEKTNEKTNIIYKINDHKINKAGNKIIEKADNNLIIEEHQKKNRLALNISDLDSKKSVKKTSMPSESEILGEIKGLIFAGDHTAAKERARAYLKVNPEAGQVRIALGSIYKEMKHYASARRELEQALKYDSGNRRLLDNIEKLNNLIVMIENEKNKLKGFKEAEELELYLR